MPFECPPVSSNPYRVCGPSNHSTDRENTPQSLSQTTFPAMPDEITDHILSFAPDSVRALRAASRVWQRIGEGFLQENAEEIHRVCSGGSSSLYNLFRDTFVAFRLDLQSSPDRSYMQFHLVLPLNIRLRGVPSTDCAITILTAQEVDPFNSRIENHNLQRVWPRVRPGIMEIDPEPDGVPGDNASAQAIRHWMRTNQPALQRITNLDLDDLGLTCVPVEMGLCTGLQELYFNNNPLLSLPETLFRGMAELEVLQLRNNQLVSLQENLFQGLASLRRLYLDSNQLISLPENLFQGLARLQWLYLDNNQLVSLPENLFQGLTELWGLFLHNNQLVSLSETLLRGLAELLQLSLSHNRLLSLPETLFQGRARLLQLNLSHNRLVSLPETLFRGLAGLEGLRLNNNQLVSLPETLFQGLARLQFLHLPENRLVSLPETLFLELTGLRELFLHYNRLVSLPENLFPALAGLNRILLYNNPQLLFFYRDLPQEQNNILFLGTIREFFSYRCTSSFSRCYQLAAGNASCDAVSAPFLQLPDRIKNAIYGLIWEGSGRPETGDPQWGEHHAFDNMEIFATALKMYVRNSFEGLTGDQKNAVYGGVYDLAQEEEGAEAATFLIRNWGEVHAFVNILRLIDALMQQQDLTIRNQTRAE